MLLAHDIAGAGAAAVLPRSGVTALLVDSLARLTDEHPTPRP